MSEAPGQRHEAKPVSPVRSGEKPVHDWRGERGYRMDPDIEVKRGLFSDEEYRRLKGYRMKINVVSRESDPQKGETSGLRKMTKPLGEVLGDDFADYIKLTSRLMPESTR